MNQEAIWSGRYQEAGDEYLFGRGPNRFLAHRAELLQQGSTALAVADGEGRNSVWLAEQGLAVTAVDISPVGVTKARKLAAGRGVAVEFAVGDLMRDDWPGARRAYDWVVAIFIQFVGPAEREAQFARLKALTAPGGRILLQGYTPQQRVYNTGGPSAVENLYTAALLQASFADWEIEELVEYEDVLDEGSGHRGRSALIGLLARKPAD
ncbi:MAG: hypothetical protein RIR00_1259 [Pseudomonadota bacterium]|jgi:cyclopropane fatty-acyl-phospholipid synthase-like methyltransferase